MTQKINRKSIIKAIIAGGNIQSQEELMGILIQKGYNVTQATLSRDLKELGVSKVYDKDFGYCYRLASYGGSLARTYKESTPSDGIVSLEFCSGMAVVKTMPGFASVVASVIDHNVTLEIAGTIAGDDTVLAVTRPQFTPQQITSSLETYLPGIGYKIKQ